MYPETVFLHFWDYHPQMLPDVMEYKSLAQSALAREAQMKPETEACLLTDFIPATGIMESSFFITLETEAYICTS